MVKDEVKTALTVVAFDHARKLDDGEGHSVYNRHGYQGRQDGYPSGDYVTGEGGEETTFNIGSYGNYRTWRMRLALAMGLTEEEVKHDPEKYEGKPFVELIDFPTNEGAIGPDTAYKLHEDFVENEPRVSDFLTDEERQIYQELMKAFSIARNHGFVVFC